MCKHEFNQDERAQGWPPAIIVVAVVVSLFLILPQFRHKVEKYWSKVEGKVPKNFLEKVNDIWKTLPDGAKEKILNFTKKEDIVIPALYRSKSGDIKPTIVSLS